MYICIYVGSWEEAYQKQSISPIFNPMSPWGPPTITQKQNQSSTKSAWAAPTQQVPSIPAQVHIIYHIS